MCKHLWATHLTPCPMCANGDNERSELPRGDTRNPAFGEWMRGVFASESNPIRDGMYVETIKRTGRVNRGTWYRLTDGNGRFWEFQAKSTVFLTPYPTTPPDRR